MKGFETLVNSVKRGVISPVYLLYGSEHFLMQRALNALKGFIAQGGLADFNISVLDCDKVKADAVVEAANTLPFCAERRLVIAENAPYFKNRRKNDKNDKNNIDDGGGKEADEASPILLNYLLQPNPTTCLVFTSPDKANRNMKVTKALEKSGQVLEFAPLIGKELEEWVKMRLAKRGKKIQVNALNYLLAINSNDLGILQGEIEKLSLLDLKRESLTLEDVKLLASASAEASIFDLVDTIGAKRSGQAIQTLREMLGQGEPPIKVLVMVTRQLRLILATKSLGSDQSQLAATLGVHPYVAQKLARQAANFSVQQLRAALETCLEVDIALKTGKGAPAILMELAVICISTGQMLNLSA